jgi:Zn-dependent peptidase ImmA (M78 family)
VIQIDRIELADIGNPVKLAAAVIANAPGITLPIPVQEIATALDIIEIKPLTISGFEGGLITTDDKSSGCILINENSSAQRQRFTIGHELGHYLNPRHRRFAYIVFRCQSNDMLKVGGR